MLKSLFHRKNEKQTQKERMQKNERDSVSLPYEWVKKAGKRKKKIKARKRERERKKVPEAFFGGKSFESLFFSLLDFYKALLKVYYAIQLCDHSTLSFQILQAFPLFSFLPPETVSKQQNFSSSLPLRFEHFFLSLFLFCIFLHELFFCQKKLLALYHFECFTALAVYFFPVFLSLFFMLKNEK